MPARRNSSPGQRSPYRLHHQVLLLLVSMLAVALLALYYVSSSRLTDAARSMAQRWAEALAETAASASAAPLALNDYGALEVTLREIIALPGVLRIDVIAAGNQPLMSLETPTPTPRDSATVSRGAPALVKYRPRDTPARPAKGHSAVLTQYRGAEVLQVWVAASDKSDLGTVGITFSQADERAKLQQMQREALLAIAVIGVLTILVAYLFLSLALRPLQRLAEFSRNLGNRLGKQLDHPPGSREVAELSEALNDASVRLRRQVDELRASEARTKNALESLAERSAGLNTVFELSPDGFALFDRERRLVFCNPALMKMTGWDSLAGVTPMSLAQFEQRFSMLCDSEHPYPPIIGGESEEVAATLTLERPARRVIKRAIRRNIAGQGESILYFRDITHETEVDRMKSNFIASAAHEFRTPMASIMGFSELLLNRDYNEATRRDLLQTINSKAQLLNRLVTELLDLARIEARAGNEFNLRLQPLKPIIDETVRTLLMPNDTRRVQITHANNLPPVEVDAEKLEQAITNLLVNAHKYSPGGGAIELRTLLRKNNGQDYVCLEIEDHGIGMTPEQIARAFERFYRADDSGNTPGTGLGLSLVKEIIERHGGKVELHSTFGVGTTAVIWLPGAARDKLPNTA